MSNKKKETGRIMHQKRKKTLIQEKARLSKGQELCTESEIFFL